MSRPILFARQPIFDQDLNTYAYQLLYRDSEGLGPDTGFDGVAATTEVLVNAFSNILENGQVKYLPALVNFNADWLYDGQLPSVPVETLILDLERHELVTDLVIEHLVQLAQSGYRLSVSANADMRLQELASIITLDVQALSPSELETHCQRIKSEGNKTILAEKVESFDEFEFCRDAGCDLFLGYFFARPQFIKGSKLARNELVMLQLIGEVHHPDASPESIEELIQKDPQLMAALLRLVNSAVFRGHRTIARISEAIVVLGLNELRKWVLLLSLTRNKQAPGELIKNILIKGKMCQSIAEGSVNVDSSTAFLTGVLSGIDALFGIPKEELLEQLPVQIEIKRAIASGGNPLGHLLQEVEAYMRGEWDTIPNNYPQQQLFSSYTDAVDWSNSILLSLSND